MIKENNMISPAAIVICIDKILPPIIQENIDSFAKLIKNEKAKKFLHTVKKVLDLGEKIEKEIILPLTQNNDEKSFCDQLRQFLPIFNIYRNEFITDLSNILDNTEAVKKLMLWIHREFKKEASQEENLLCVVENYIESSLKYFHFMVNNPVFPEHIHLINKLTQESTKLDLIASCIVFELSKEESIIFDMLVILMSRSVEDYSQIIDSIINIQITQKNFISWQDRPVLNQEQMEKITCPFPKEEDWEQEWE